MEYTYKDLNIYYQKEGNGKPLILLHGWGTSGNTFTSLINELKLYFTIYTFDLPGFGLSDEPNEVFSVNDYALMIKDFCFKHEIKNPIILGHSFGGRVAIKYASSNKNVDKIILVDSAGIKRHLSLSKKIEIILFKIKKWYYIKTNNIIKLENHLNQSGSSDYQKASIMMKKVLVKAINEDLKMDLKKIKCETLILWGAMDKTTPVKDAHVMNKLIKGSSLIVIDDVGHFPYLEDKVRFNLILKSYLIK